MKANCVGHILCRTGLLRHLIEGNKRENRRDGKTAKKIEHLLDDSKETIRSWKLKRGSKSHCMENINPVTTDIILQLYIF